MKKIHWSEWMGIIPFLIVICLLIWGYHITSNPVILNLIIISFLLLIYLLTYSFGLKLFEFWESNLKNDVELLKLEKDNLALLWAFSSGIGIAFLIPGMSIISENPLMATMGLILLSVGNLIWQTFYYPRYAFLVRKREIIIDLKKEILGEIVSVKDGRTVAHIIKKNKEEKTQKVKINSNPHFVKEIDYAKKEP
ncbi:MAG: hypothetical protein KJ949_01300 [Nanoarchaeota archaeon]|nr:hypothetical protein [Nanoarchaeota archaeon]